MALHQSIRYGIPSPKPGEWTDTVRRVLGELAADQLLIVSVVGSGSTPDEIVRDFVLASRYAAETGANAIELNLSFPVAPPGTPMDRGLYCEDVELSRRIVEAVACSLDRFSVAIVVKLALLEKELLTALVDRISPIIDGICGINALPIKVLDEYGADVFPDRPAKPRIAGAALREYTQAFVSELVDIRLRSLDYFDIIATGGVMTADDVVLLRNLGADAIQSATGSFLNPFLAWDAHQQERNGAFTQTPGRAGEYFEAVRANVEQFAKSGAPLVPQKVAKAVVESLR